MAWHSFDLDRKAQDLVIKYRDKDVLNESHKMRVTATYGLERFWGEHLRLMGKTNNEDDYKKGEFWLATWKELVKIMKVAGIKVPEPEIPDDKKKNLRNGESIRRDKKGNFETEDIQSMVNQLWDKKHFPVEHQRVTLAVLTQFCDSLIWWTQRYKKLEKQEK
ncbi:hypothetical protein WA1_36290 [Scytonema hofmannii PCC 7110]|uniref:CRISPR type III-B/RAMP module-associated protein Cmr5 n=1 Tax=Scytonema hofmannii PCC 7110 TaxID=128403 RepID=A0A139X1Q2_9CYAN|nr:hypothetical protein [Scytonema hofmannii]KYC38639.1 hypothetical protein WA1_36290 [Scytonema hofmannii PCC 7110]